LGKADQSQMARRQAASVHTKGQQNKQKSTN